MDECESNTPEQDMEIAESALADGDPKHAVFHIAWALAADPRRREWLAVLDRIIAAADDPIRLAPLEEETSFAMAAVHAYILGRLGRSDRAIGILLHVFAVRPDIPYLAWARAWLKNPEIATDFDVSALNTGVASVLRRFPGRFVASAEDRTALESLVPLVEQLSNLRDQWVRRSESVLARLRAIVQRGKTRSDRRRFIMFRFFLASVLRKVGRFDEALRLAEEDARWIPCYTMTIGLAMAQAALGKVDAAVASYRDSVRQDPADVSGLIDAAELLWEHGRNDEAERTYEEVLQRSPGDPRAEPSYCYLRYLSSNFEETWLERLRDYLDAHPDHSQARGLLWRITPYFGYLPTPGDAFVNLLQQISSEVENSDSKGLGRMTGYASSSLEAPSNRLAYGLLMRRYGEPEDLEGGPGTIPEPDPRLPLGRVSYQLWRYEGDKPIPVLPPPPDDIVQAIAAIAGSGYHLSTWAESAARLGGSLGADRVDDLLGVMVHPPMAPDSMTPWDWIQRIQFAATLAVTGLDEGWAGSLRRKVLISLVNGPLDWSVTSAIVALAHLAATDPVIATEALEVFRTRYRNLPDRGYTCYAVPLVLAMLEQPGVTGAERSELRAKLRELA